MKSSNRVRDIFHPYSKQCFMWSLKPIRIWMQIIGIELNCSKIRINRSRIINSFLCLMWLAWNVSGNLVVYFVRTDQPVMGVTRVVSLIKLISEIMFSCVIHFEFILMTRTKWQQLYKTLKKIEMNFSNSQKMYKRCHNVSKAAAVFFILVRFCIVRHT